MIHKILRIISDSTEKYIELLIKEGFLNDTDIQYIIRKYPLNNRNVFIKIDVDEERYEYLIYFSAGLVEEYFKGYNYFRFGYDPNKGAVVFKPSESGFELKDSKEGSNVKRSFSKEITQKIFEVTGQKPDETRHYDVEWDEEEEMLYLIY